MIETVFLEVLIIAFLIGNGLLFLVPKKEMQKTETMQRPPESFAHGNPAIESIVMEERIGILQKRVENLEKEIFNAGKSPSSPANSEISRKLERLEEFRQNARIEIEALKQRLDALRKELNLAPYSTKANPDFKIPDERLHELVYNRAR